MDLGPVPRLVGHITGANDDGEIANTTMVGAYMNTNRVYYDRTKWFSLIDWYNFVVFKVWKYTGIELAIMEKPL